MDGIAPPSSLGARCMAELSERIPRPRIVSHGRPQPQPTAARQAAGRSSPHRRPGGACRQHHRHRPGLAAADGHLLHRPTASTRSRLARAGMISDRGRLYRRSTTRPLDCGARQGGGRVHTFTLLPRNFPEGGVALIVIAWLRALMVIGDRHQLPVQLQSID